MNTIFNPPISNLATNANLYSTGSNLYNLLTGVEKNLESTGYNLYSWLTGISGNSGGGEVSISNTIYVDMDFGNDNTAIREREDKPFQTLNAAIDIAQSGDVIMVRPGYYLPTGNLAKHGISWYMEPNVNIGYFVPNATTALFELSNVMRCNVYGYADFIVGITGASVTASAGFVNTDFSACYFEIDCRSLTETVFTTPTTRFVGDGKIHARINTITYGSHNLNGTAYINTVNQNTLMQIKGSFHVDYWVGSPYALTQLAGFLDIGSLEQGKFEVSAGGSLFVHAKVADYAAVEAKGPCHIVCDLTSTTVGNSNHALKISTTDIVDYIGIASVGSRTDSYPVFFATSGATLRTQGSFFKQISAGPDESIKCDTGVTATLMNVFSCSATKSGDTNVTVYGTPIFVDPNLL